MLRIKQTGVAEKVNIIANTFGQARIGLPQMTGEEERALMGAVGSSLVSARIYPVCSAGPKQFCVMLGDRKAQFDFEPEDEEECRLFATRSNDPELQATFYPRDPQHHEDPELWLT